MVHMLLSMDNMHGILRQLYTDMMTLCEGMTSVASGIAGLGALLYISYRVWQSLARGEAIDLFPLLRPFALGICIMFFPTLVLGSLNGILSPVVQATHSLMVGQTFNLLYVCLAFIMINVGREFEMDKSRWRSYTEALFSSALRTLSATSASSRARKREPRSSMVTREPNSA